MTCVTVHKQPRYDPAAIKAQLAATGLFTFARGDKVFLKPNLLGAFPPEKAVTTHPAVVQAVAELCLDAGAHVAIGDSPGAVSLNKALKVSGIQDIVRRLGLTVADSTLATEVRGMYFTRLTLLKQALDADCLINLPKVKTHGAAVLTLAVKNLFGLIPGFEKAQWHLRTGGDPQAFARLLADAAYISTRKRSLHVADGVVSMQGRGPSHGRPVETAFIAASPSPLSLDLAICRILGFPENDLPSNVEAKKLFPPEDADVEMRFEGFEEPVVLPIIKSFDLIKPSDAATPYLVPQWLWRAARRWWLPRPAVDEAKCIGCRQCERICAAGALRFGSGQKLPRVAYDQCIRCFCCEEVCPEGAMTVHRPWLRRLFGGSQR